MPRAGGLKDAASGAPPACPRRRDGRSRSSSPATVNTQPAAQPSAGGPTSARPPHPRLQNVQRWSQLSFLPCREPAATPAFLLSAGTVRRNTWLAWPLSSSTPVVVPLPSPTVATSLPSHHRPCSRGAARFARQMSSVTAACYIPARSRWQSSAPAAIIPSHRRRHPPTTTHLPWRRGNPGASRSRRSKRKGIKIALLGQ
jgi:hypothetical protein